MGGFPGFPLPFPCKTCGGGPLSGNGPSAACGGGPPGGCGPIGFRGLALSGSIGGLGRLGGQAFVLLAVVAAACLPLVHARLAWLDPSMVACSVEVMSCGGIQDKILATAGTPSADLCLSQDGSLSMVDHG